MLGDASLSPDLLSPPANYSPSNVSRVPVSPTPRIQCIEEALPSDSLSSHTKPSTYLAQDNFDNTTLGNAIMMDIEIRNDSRTVTENDIQDDFSSGYDPLVGVIHDERQILTNRAIVDCNSTETETPEKSCVPPPIIPARDNETTSKIGEQVSIVGRDNLKSDTEDRESQRFTDVHMAEGEYATPSMLHPAEQCQVSALTPDVSIAASCAPANADAKRYDSDGEMPPNVSVLHPLVPL